MKSACATRNNAESPGLTKQYSLSTKKLITSDKELPRGEDVNSRNQLDMGNVLQRALSDYAFEKNTMKTQPVSPAKLQLDVASDDGYSETKSQVNLYKTKFYGGSTVK